MNEFSEITPKGEKNIIKEKAQIVWQKLTGTSSLPQSELIMTMQEANDLWKQQKEQKSEGKTVIVHLPELLTLRTYIN